MPEEPTAGEDLTKAPGERSIDKVFLERPRVGGGVASEAVSADDGTLGQLHLTRDQEEILHDPSMPAAARSDEPRQGVEDYIAPSYRERLELSRFNAGGTIMANQASKAEGLKRRFRWLGRFNDYEISQISWCDEGEQLQAGNQYFDISNPERGVMTARSNERSAKGTCLVSRSAVNEEIWNKLTSISQRSGGGAGQPQQHT